MSSLIERKAITVPGAPAPVGPYSPAILSGRFLFLSGQIALDPQTGQLLELSIEEETRQVMQNVGTLLQQAGLRHEHLVKVTIYLTDMNQFPAVNAVYSTFFPEGTAYPARETVGVLRLPRNANVEISGIALLP